MKSYDENCNVNNEINNGKGYIKEYDEFDYNVLKFEGEYLNGKKNGNGKEYLYLSKNHLVFEVVYSNIKKLYE